jgi:thiosulfate/3-mercaptopyruvate sulfurtransferase
MYADAQYVEAAQSQQGKLLVDSRERLNFLTEHIPTARNIPYTMLGSDGSILRKADELKRMIENRGITPSSEIITYCGSVGTLSGLAYYALKIAGYNNVKLYPKSFKEWKSLGKPKDEFKEANYWDLSAE